MAQDYIADDETVDFTMNAVCKQPTVENIKFLIKFYNELIKPGMTHNVSEAKLIELEYDIIIKREVFHDMCKQNGDWGLYKRAKTAMKDFPTEEEFLEKHPEFVTGEVE